MHTSQQKNTNLETVLLPSHAKHAPHLVGRNAQRRSCPGERLHAGQFRQLVCRSLAWEYMVQNDLVLVW